MAKEIAHARAAASVAAPWSVAASTEDVERRAQLALVHLLTDETEPKAEMRAMADEYRRGVAEGRITSSH